MVPASRSTFRTTSAMAGSIFSAPSGVRTP